MEYTTDPVARELGRVVASDPIDLARAALVIAKIEYPALDPAPYLDTLERLGARAKDLLLPLAAGPVRDRIRVLNEFLYTSERFSGNRAYYGDYRNSLINLVLERRVGIPISLALVYMEVARRADLPSVGVAFPGHFLVRIPDEPESANFVIIDPFNGGAELDEAGCRAILVREFNDEVPFTPGLLDPCTPRQMLARMLNNLKRTYLELRSFAHARRITDLLISTDPTTPGELRDRGLLAYHLDDFPAALRDLEEYLRLNAWSGEDDREERDRIWEHVKTLRRKVASMN